tara:strand:+ start:1043 stop:1177 length:135 start_codon:yes stop_codon:yes gene_type:complete
MIEEALEIINEIEENIKTCCAITMEPDDVLELIERLRKIIKDLQ